MHYGFWDALLNLYFSNNISNLNNISNNIPIVDIGSITLCRWSWGNSYRPKY